MSVWPAFACGKHHWPNIQCTSITMHSLSLSCRAKTSTSHHDVAPGTWHDSYVGAHTCAFRPSGDPHEHVSLRPSAPLRLFPPEWAPRRAHAAVSRHKNRLVTCAQAQFPMLCGAPGARLTTVNKTHKLASQLPRLGTLTHYTYCPEGRRCFTPPFYAFRTGHRPFLYI